MKDYHPIIKDDGSIRKAVHKIKKSNDGIEKPVILARLIKYALNHLTDIFN